MSLEISKRIRNEEAQDSTLNIGEPMSRLTPTDFHKHQKALEQLGVPPQNARREAARLRLAHCRTSKVRQEMISERTNGNNHHSAVLAAERTLDTVAINAFSSCLKAVEKNHHEQVRLVSNMPTEKVIFEESK